MCTKTTFSVSSEAFEDTSDNVTSDDDEGAGASAGEGSDGGQEQKFTKTFTVELSHEDTRYALYNLIRSEEHTSELQSR